MFINFADSFFKMKCGEKKIQDVKKNPPSWDLKKNVFAKIRSIVRIESIILKE